MGRAAGVLNARAEVMEKRVASLASRDLDYASSGIVHDLRKLSCSLSGMCDICNVLMEYYKKGIDWQPAAKQIDKIHEHMQGNRAAVQDVSRQCAVIRSLLAQPTPAQPKPTQPS